MASGSQAFSLLFCPKLLCDRGQATSVLWSLDSRQSCGPGIGTASAPPACHKSCYCTPPPDPPLTTGIPPPAQVKWSRDGQVTQQARDLPKTFHSELGTNDLSLETKLRRVMAGAAVAVFWLMRGRRQSERQKPTRREGKVEPRTSGAPALAILEAQPLPGLPDIWRLKIINFPSASPHLNQVSITCNQHPTA